MPQIPYTKKGVAVVCIDARNIKDPTALLELDEVYTIAQDYYNRAKHRGIELKEFPGKKYHRQRFRRATDLEAAAASFNAWRSLANFSL